MTEIVLSLEKRERLAKSSQKKHPSLHPRWAYRMQCVFYEPLDHEMNQADVIEWHERLQFLVNDCRELLRLEYSLFWCQVIFEPTIIPCINSFLKTSPRPYDIKNIQTPAEYSDLHDELHRLIFLLLVRLSTYKESKTDFMTPEVFGEIIYTNYVFDITKLLDICCLYGEANQKLVGKMIENIFQCQPKYKADLNDWFCIMKKILDKFRLDSKFSTNTGSPQKLGLATEHLTSVELIERLLYAVDITSSLDAFLQSCTFLCEDFLKNGFDVVLASFFEDLFPHFEEEIRICKFRDESDQQLCRRALKRVHDVSLSIYRRILFPVCLGPLLDVKREKGQHCVELFTNSSLNIIQFRRFHLAMENRYPFEEDLDLVRQCGFESCLDDAQVSFIVEAIRSSKQEFIKHKNKVSPNKESSLKPKPCMKKPRNPKASDHSVYNDEPGCPINLSTNSSEAILGACASTPDIGVLVSSVQDIMPDLGSGFIEACLKHFDYSSEKVINAVLEGLLPPELNSIDRNLPLQIENAQKVDLVTGSIYDGDEFDHRSGRKLDMSKIHKGKRDTVEVFVKDEKDKILEHYDLVEDWELPGNDNAEYDDEYDDTYESHLSSTVDDAKDALQYRRPWVLPRALQTGKGAGSQDDDIDSDNNEVSSMETDGNARVRDIVSTNINERQLNPDDRKIYDVKGQGRGKGQTAEVIHNRQYKDRHKGRQANHNRRFLSDKKRQKTGFY